MMTKDKRGRAGEECVIPSKYFSIQKEGGFGTQLTLLKSLGLPWSG
jgi:hypothetical protein